MAKVKVMYEGIEVGTVLTNRSLTIDEALELINFDEAAFCEAHGFEAVDPADFRIEYETEAEPKKRYFAGEYVGLNDVTYSGYYTVEGNVVVSFTTDDGETFDPVGATIEDVLSLPELPEEPGAKIEIRVKNAGFYGEDENGTWEEIREALAEKAPGWHEYNVTKHSYIGGRKHYWGDLLDEERNVVYTFYAVFDAEEGEVEVQKA